MTRLLLGLALAAPSIALPGGPPVGIDYTAYDRANHRLWIPAGNTGNVDVIDEATHAVTPVGGFVTRPSPRPGWPSLGPSSVTVGDGVVWVGSRGDDRVCAFDARTLARKRCVQLSAMPDGIAWVAATKELWVTTPRERSLTIVDGAGKIASLSLPGEPEGYAVDGDRFYTNLEDRDRTLVLDVRGRQILATWSPGCGEKGPRGLALDPARRLLFVACTDGAVSLSLDGGKVLGRLTTGAGVDNLDYLPERGLLYVAASRAGTLTIAKVGTRGQLDPVATLPTAPGARNPVVDEAGTAYVPDSREGEILVLPLPASLH